MSPNFQKALVGLGNAYYDACKPEDAIMAYKQALAQDSSEADVHYNLANAYFLTEEYEEAVRNYEKAIELNADKPESYYNLGNALCKL